MKNPLIDALREAQSDATDETNVTADSAGDSAIELSSDVPATNDDTQREDDPPIEESTTAPEAGSELSDAGLDLLQTGSISRERISDHLSDGDSTHAPKNESPEAIEEQLPGTEDQKLALNLEDNESSDLSTGPVAVMSAQGGEFYKRTPLIPKLGRLTPAFCLFALSVSAGGYYFVNIVSAKSLNEDLNGMARRMQAFTPRQNDEIQSRNSIAFSKLAAVNTGVELDSTTSGETFPRQVDQPSASAFANEKSTDEIARANTSRPSSEQTNVSITHTSADSGRIRDQAHATVMNAYAAYQIKDYGLAEANYLRALAVEPHHIDALAGIAAVFLQTNRTAAALESYEKLLGVDPSNAIATSAILSIHADDPKWDSESELKLLLQRYPAAHQLHYALGTVFVQEARWADARQSFLAAHRLAPDNANYSYNTAVSMEKVGDQAAARLYYETALETAGQESNIDRSAVIAHLKALSSGHREQL